MLSSYPNASLEVRIQASSVGTREDLMAVLAMGAAGKVRCHNGHASTGASQ